MWYHVMRDGLRGFYVSLLIYAGLELWSSFRIYRLRDVLSALYFTDKYCKRQHFLSCDKKMPLPFPLR